MTFNLPLRTVMACVASTLSALAGQEQSARPALDTVTVQYVPSTADFPNPERGFYARGHPSLWLGTERTPLSESALRDHRNRSISVIGAYFVIDEFLDAPLSQAVLDAIAADFATVRAAGLKVIPRFTYSFPCAGSLEPCGPSTFGVTDPPLSRVLQHIAQLAPVLQANADVIALMEVGFVGAWGEWHSSTNQLVGDGNATTASSAAIVQAVLSALPARRMTAIRYPYQKQSLLGSQPLTAAVAFSGLPQARVGHHNDCFLANSSDGGTYSTPYPPFGNQPELFKSYLNQDNRYLPQVGETCSFSPEAQPYIQCPNALADLARMRWSTINADYQPQVIALWRQQGCFADISRRLGYRFRLIAADLPTAAGAGSLLPVRFSVTNDGFASPYNPRAVELVLRDQATRTVYALPIPVDPRLWGAGETQTVDTTIAIPASLPQGTYDLLLNLPDPEPALRSRPEYSIRLANEGLWEPTTGYNSLRAQITIDASTGSGGSTAMQSPVVNGSQVTLAWSHSSPASVLEYILEAGTSPGSSNLYNASVGATRTLSASVAAGTYYVRVRARAAAGIGAPSNEVSFTVGGGACSGPPPAPFGVSGAVVGGVARVAWNPAPGAVSYTVQAGASAGASNLFNGSVGAAVDVSAPVAAGFRAFVRVFAVNACGMSAPSPEIVVQ